MSDRVRSFDNGDDSNNDGGDTDDGDSDSDDGACREAAMHFTYDREASQVHPRQGS